jgi:TPR repeat protein
VRYAERLPNGNRWLSAASAFFAALCFHHGVGVPVDLEEALHWYLPRPHETRVC